MYMEVQFIVCYSRKFSFFYTVLKLIEKKMQDLKLIRETIIFKTVSYSAILSPNFENIRDLRKLT